MEESQKKAKITEKMERSWTPTLLPVELVREIFDFAATAPDGSKSVTWVVCKFDCHFWKDILPDVYAWDFLTAATLLKDIKLLKWGKENGAHSQYAGGV